jgi:hypothetical protein
LAIGNWQLATGNWQLATGNWQLATGNWQLATGNWKVVGDGEKRLHIRPSFFYFSEIATFRPDVRQMV